MKKTFCVVLLILVIPVFAKADERKNKRSIPNKEVSLTGSPESLEKQNHVADEENLIRIMSDESLAILKSENVLLPIPEVVKVDDRLDPKWQFVLYQTQVFVEEQGIAFINKFGRRVQLNSAVRTWPRQVEISKANPNAVMDILESRRPPHITGATIDIAKKGMSEDELNWWRDLLLELEEQDMVEATEEWNQLVFHVMVFNTYLGEGRGNK